MKRVIARFVPKDSEQSGEKGSENGEEPKVSKFVESTEDHHSLPGDL